MILTLAAVIVALGPAAPAAATEPGFGPRQYYDTTWSYSPSYGYYYVHYYYLPAVTYTTYEYHYCIYFASRPAYVYYYNPTAQVYWGRYELGSQGDKRYSILAEKDRKKDLKDIPDKAFPTPGKMPTIPGAKDDVAIEPPPENVPKDKPAK
jgi:hypothetical protein